MGPLGNDGSIANGILRLRFFEGSILVFAGRFLTGPHLCEASVRRGEQGGCPRLFDNFNTTNRDHGKTTIARNSTRPDRSPNLGQTLSHRSRLLDFRNSAVSQWNRLEGVLTLRLGRHSRGASCLGRSTQMATASN